MNRYRVTFFKNLLSSDGHRFKCQQGSIDVRANDDAAAAASAQCEYAHLKNVEDWTKFADCFEIETIGNLSDLRFSALKH